jgi:hypothetical protein
LPAYIIVGVEDPRNVGGVTFETHKVGLPDTFRARSVKAEK